MDPAGDFKSQKAKIQIDSLSNYAGFGGGSYRMTSVKRMTASSAFLDMPYENRGCQVELFQDCRTRRLLEACKCVPMEVQESFGTNKEFFRQQEEMKGCSPKGRDCIETKSTQRFNCSLTCEGMHADVEWVEDKVMSDLERRGNSKKGFETEKENTQNLRHFSSMIDEYRRFKKGLFSSFNFNANATLTQFGMFSFLVKECIILVSGERVPESTLELVQIFFDTATFDDVERDQKIKFDAQLSLIGGTMGLLTGFSIISGIEVVFFLFKIFRSLKIRKAAKNGFENDLGKN